MILSGRDQPCAGASGSEVSAGSTAYSVGSSKLVAYRHELARVEASIGYRTKMLETCHPRDTQMRNSVRAKLQDLHIHKGFFESRIAALTDPVTPPPSQPSHQPQLPKVPQLPMVPQLPTAQASVVQTSFQASVQASVKASVQASVQAPVAQASIVVQGASATSTVGWFLGGNVPVAGGLKRPLVSLGSPLPEEPVSKRLRHLNPTPKKPPT
ncbi:hypothetical protein F5Y18DRAFT_345158 [Xylariaceae sp. FL1019]|nr:hypothetical protein F5Y18DRAFT_345158 [Xylariaceae sp. FL1019]